MLILSPPNIRLDPRKLPHALHSAVPHRRPPMGMPPRRDLARPAVVVRVPLVRDAHLVQAHHLVLALPAEPPRRAAHEVLRLEARVAQDFWVRRHRHEVGARHCLPQLT